ncbi:MAG: hypothetical protein ACYC6B_01995 [Thermoleophilia bacterium]
MIARISGFVVLTMILAMAFGASWAPAQETGTCGGANTPQGTFTLSVQSGPPGTSTMLEGSIPVVLDMVSDGQIIELSFHGGIGVWWLETGNEQLLAELPVTIDQARTDHFSGNIMVPANAAPGLLHDIALIPLGYTDPVCLPFTVTQSAQADAYTQITSLPSTGVKTLLPAAALALVAGGAALAGHRRRLA